MSNFFILLIMLCMLTSCEQTYDYRYLMRHPRVLKEEIDHCQENRYIPPTKVEYCGIVMYAGENMLSVMKQEEDNPEKFGERILTIETELAKTKIEFNAAQKNYEIVLKKQSGKNTVEEAKEERDRLQKLYKEQYQEIQVMLGVIAIHTPN